MTYRHFAALSFISVLSLIPNICADDIKPYDRLARDNIRLTAYELQSGTKNHTHWTTYWGSYSRSVTQLKLLEVKLSSVGNPTPPDAIEFFRVLRVDSSKVKPSKSEALDIVSDGKGAWCVNLESRHSQTYYRSSGEYYFSGQKMVGWFVRAIRDGRVVGYAASPPAYERFAENPALID